MAVSVAMSIWYPYTGSSMLAISLQALGVYTVLVYDLWVGFAGGLRITLTLPAMALSLFHSAFRTAFCIPWALHGLLPHFWLSTVCLRQPMPFCQVPILCGSTRAPCWVSRQ